MKFIPPRARLADLRRVAHPALSRQGWELLDKNERTIDFPPQAMEEIRRLVTPFLLRAYPEPEPLYQRLSGWLGLPREMLLLTWAADGGLRAVFETFVESRDEVVHLAPSYAMVPIYIQLSDAVSIEVPFERDLSLPLDRILERIGPGTKLVVLANPNQPIERAYEEPEMRALLQACAQRDALLLVDEAYYPFCPLTAIPLVKEYGNLVVARTFSKAFGIAGIRLGYLVSQPENIAHLTKVRPMYETHSFAIALGIYLLENDHLMTSYVAQVQESRSLLIPILQGMGFSTWNQWGNSILVGLPPDWKAQELSDALKRQGFLIRVETHPLLPNHVRFTVGSTEQTERLAQALREIGVQRRMEETVRR